MDNPKRIRTLQSFSPGWSDPEILEKTLVGRLDLVNRLEELVIDGDYNSEGATTQFDGNIAQSI